MKKSLSLIVFTCLFFAACQKSELSAEPTQVELATSANTFANKGSEISMDVPVSNVFYNECCNEEVYVTGLARIVVNKNIFHFVVTELSGVGLTTGFNYTSQIPSITTNIFYSNPNEGILTATLDMTNSDGCSFRLKFTFRLNVNANGDVVVDFQKIDNMCH